MPVGYSNQPELTPSIATQGLINQTDTYLSYLSANGNIEYRTTALPTSFVGGEVYLIGPGVAGYTAGQMVVSTSLVASGLVTLTPPIGTQVGAFVRVAGDWSLNSLQHGGSIDISANLAVPATFRGNCLIFTTVAGLVVSSGIANAGLMGTALAINSLYHFKQTASIARLTLIS